jgi:hypothetical protein
VTALLTFGKRHKKKTSTNSYSSNSLRVGKLRAALLTIGKRHNEKSSANSLGFPDRPSGVEQVLGRPLTQTTRE